MSLTTLMSGSSAMGAQSNASFARDRERAGEHARGRGVARSGSPRATESTDDEDATALLGEPVVGGVDDAPFDLITEVGERREHHREITPALPVGDLMSRSTFSRNRCLTGGRSRASAEAVDESPTTGRPSCRRAHAPVEGSSRPSSPGTGTRRPRGRCRGRRGTPAASARKLGLVRVEHLRDVVVRRHVLGQPEVVDRRTRSPRPYAGSRPSATWCS